MTREELKRDVAIHYDDGIAMNDHEGAIEEIIGSAEAYARQQVIETMEWVLETIEDCGQGYVEKTIKELKNEA